MISIVINPVGLLITLLAGVVYYQILDASSWWLFLSCIGIHILMGYFTKRMAMMHAANTIGTLAGECQKLALYIQQLSKENKELSKKLGVKENP